MAHATWSRQAGYAASPSNLSTRRSTSALSSAELNEARQVTQYEYVIHIRCDDTIPTTINYSLQLVMSCRALTKSVANLSIKEKAMNLSSFTIVATFVAATLIPVQTAIAQTADQLRRDAHAALNSLYAKNPGAKEIGKKAVAVLVFPGILKAGLGSAASTARVCFSKAARQSATTIRPVRRMVCRQAGRSTATRCSF